MMIKRLNKFVDCQLIRLKLDIKWLRNNLIRMMIYLEMMMKKKRSNIKKI